MFDYERVRYMKECSKRQLVDAAKTLLQMEADIPTSRGICDAANANLSAINYYFKSKDQLLKTAVDEILEEEYQTLQVNPSLSSKEKLRFVLYSMSEIVMRYRKLTAVSMPFLLLEDEIQVPLTILPYVRELSPKASESECRIVAYELISFLQLALYRADEFKRYSGIDISDSKQMYAVIDHQLQVLFD